MNEGKGESLFHIATWKWEGKGESPEHSAPRVPRLRPPLVAAYFSFVSSQYQPPSGIDHNSSIIALCFGVSVPPRCFF